MAKDRERNQALAKDVRRVYRKHMGRNILSAIYVIATTILLLGVVLWQIMPESLEMNVGEAAPETVTAIAAVENAKATKDAKQAARDAVAPVYRVDDEITSREVGFFTDTVFAGFMQVSSFGKQEWEKQKKLLGEDTPPTFDTADVERFAGNELSFLGSAASQANVLALLRADPEGLDELQTWFLSELDSLYQTGVTRDNLAQTTEVFSDKIRNTEIGTDSAFLRLLADTVEDNLQPNCVVDEAATEQARDSAENAVAPIYVQKGEVIVTKNEIVTQSQYDMVKKLGMLSDGGFSGRLVFGSMGVVLCLLGMLMAYVLIFERKLAHRPKKVLLLCLLIVVDVAICLAFKSAGWTMMMNTAMGVVLIVVFFGENLALVVNAALSVLISMLCARESDLFNVESVTLMLSMLIGGTAAVFMCRNVRVASRSRILLPGVVAGFVGAIMCFLVLYLGGKSLYDSAISALFPLAGGVVASLFSAGSLSAWESAFNMLTQSKLLELSNSGSDLLRKISIEIPGTYQHSTTVAELAENAAKDIGANAMLARAAALYHDIGKMRIPECYTENQTAESKNFHDTLSPHESAQMIFSHITEGVKMARENKLPREIVDVIQQHHGTSAVLYFYNKAKEADPATQISDFRYPGPNPQTKEAGIILLADCIEASVRSLDEKTTESVTAQIEKMFKSRMEDGELDECDLSLRDINIIKQSFAATLAAIYHTRIKYEQKKQEET